ncbi:hypothetical protein CJ195_00535 [Bacillus sp. UMB0899]|uniref:TrkA C-terminal domain-containing protein n=1 Tax=Metabacillus schmidteae TaxID=2730405 RepID=UPI000C80239A|nr:TrkA C-terminal domain-containing protein [Metabacillus schmidteae]PMC40232.1 hypothetical protein CJ195_00535 [Bacillus sp. UMB0899]
MALFFLVIYFIVIATVIEIHVILFRLTDLKLEVSRFQVISLMTGTGFTTGESELILGHPIRRKLAIFLISFGAVSLAVIISSISNFLSSNMNTKEVIYIAGGAILILGLLKLPFIQKTLSKLFTYRLKRNVEIGDLPIRDVFLTEEEDDLLNLHIYKESSLASKSINQVITEHDQLEFVVLFIKRGEMKIRTNLYDTKIQEGDQILLFGNEKVMNENFKNDINIMEEQLDKQIHVPIDEHSVNNKKSP